MICDHFFKLFFTTLSLHLPYGVEHLVLQMFSRKGWGRQWPETFEKYYMVIFEKCYMVESLHVHMNLTNLHEPAKER